MRLRCMHDFQEERPIPGIEGGHANFLACGDLIPIMLSLAFEYADARIDIRAKSLL